MPQDGTGAASLGTVHVVDDDPEVCAATTFLLRTAGHQVLTHGSGRDFLDTADLQAVPGCVVLDYRMPDLSGLAVLEKLVAAGSSLQVVLVTAHGNVPLAVRAMKTGAVDVLEKPYKDHNLLDAVARALAVSEAGHGSQRAVARDRLAGLTPRECQVLDELMRGQRNKGIASELGLSPRTVESYRSNLMGKLGARSLSEVVRIAHEAGLAPPSA